MNTAELQPTLKSIEQKSDSRTWWQLQEAKAHFSEVFRRALETGPQRVTRQGKDMVVVISAQQFEQLTARAKQPRTLVQFLQESPLGELNLERDPDYGRDIEL